LANSRMITSEATLVGTGCWLICWTDC
jgi:hypothetical protein